MLISSCAGIQVSPFPHGSTDSLSTPLQLGCTNNEYKTNVCYHMTELMRERVRCFKSFSGRTDHGSERPWDRQRTPLKTVVVFVGRGDGLKGRQQRTAG